MHPFTTRRLDRAIFGRRATECARAHSGSDRPPFSFFSLFACCSEDDALEGRISVSTRIPQVQTLFHAHCGEGDQLNTCLGPFPFCLLRADKRSYCTLPAEIRRGAIKATKQRTGKTALKNGASVYIGRPQQGPYSSTHMCALEWRRNNNIWCSTLHSHPVSRYPPSVKVMEVDA